MSRIGRGQALRERLKQRKEAAANDNQTPSRIEQILDNPQLNSSELRDDQNENQLTGREKRLLLLEKIKARRKTKIENQKSNHDAQSLDECSQGSSSSPDDFERHRNAHHVIEESRTRDVGELVPNFRPLSSDESKGSGRNLRSSGYYTLSHEDGKSSSGSDVEKLALQELNINRGSSGINVKLEANYIKLNVKKSNSFYEYQVRFNPSLDSRNARFVCLGKLTKILGKTSTFDGSKLCLPYKLKDEVTTFDSEYLPHFPQVKVGVIYKNSRSYTDREAIQFYNHIFGKIMKELKLIQMSNGNYFNPVKATSLPHMKLEIWPGYVTSVLPREGGLMLQCDVSNRILRQDTVYHALRDLYSMHKIAYSRGNTKQTFPQMAKVRLEGEHVLTRYNNKHYRIDEIDFSANPESEFQTSRGEKMSFIEYYKRQYNLEIKDLLQPLIISRPKKRSKEDPGHLICLIPELCYLTGLNEDLRADQRKMKELSRHIQASPAERGVAVQKFVASVKENQTCCEMLSNWGLELESAALSINGRVLESVKLMFGNNQSVMANEDFENTLKKASMFNCVPLEKWSIICDRRKKQAVDNFLAVFYDISKNLGMMVARPNVILLPYDNIPSFVKTIEEENEKNIQMVFCIVNEKRADKYSAIKKVCYVQLGLPCQVMLAKQTLNKTPKTRTVISRIGMQMNAKLGGEVWAMKSPFKNTMVVGIDVYHDTENRAKSWCGLVASINLFFTRWTSTCERQDENMEISPKMRLMFSHALEQYQMVNDTLPDRIIIYRDGVGDSRLDFTKNTELVDMKKAFSSYPGYNPKVTFVVVSKRINTRLLKIQGGNRVNPSPGTVVDHTITSRHRFDFFLISQKVTQGTVSPSHYIVLADENELGPDKIQKLTYRLCYMYYHCSYPIKVPAPCLYAHRIAGQTGEHLKKKPEKMNSNLLFYL